MTSRRAICMALLTFATVAHAADAVKPAPHMPGPKYVDTNGIRLAYYEQGEGTPVVLCHGFPELAISWRHQMKALSAAGYRVIVPDQRGYGLTGGPEDPSLYTIPHLCDDLVGMLDALEIEKAVFIGHDWGGGVVWAMARLHPDRCLGVVGVNTPAMRPQSLPPVKRTTPSLIVRSPNYYQMTFMKPGRAEAVLEKDVRATMETMLRRGGIWNVEEFAKLPEDSPERQLDLLTIIAKGNPPGELFIPEDVMQYFVDTFTATGFTGGLNWYRNAMQSFGAISKTSGELNMPCLYIGAEHDVVLPPSSSDGMEDFIDDLEKKTIADSGHWTQQEKPDEVNEILIDWLGRKVQ